PRPLNGSRVERKGRAAQAARPFRLDLVISLLVLAVAVQPDAVEVIREVDDLHGARGAEGELRSECDRSHTIAVHSGICQVHKRICFRRSFRREWRIAPTSSIAMKSACCSNTFARRRCVKRS